MAVNFPDSPSNGDAFTSGALTFTWNGEAWKLDPSSGTKGEKGQKGEVGVTGSKGEKGQKGEVGPKGQKGEIGATGGTGGTGQKGQKGEVGATGSGGSAGSDGDKGQKGEVGATGSGTGTADKIFENNTSVECVDTGTGVVEVKVDGTETITVKQGEVGINVTDPKATLDISRTSDNYPVLNLQGGDNTYGDLTVENGEILQTGHWDRSTSTFTERFRIGTKGALGIEGANYGSSGQVLSSKGGNYPPGWVNATNVAGLKGQKGEESTVAGDKGQKGEVGAGAKGEKGEIGATGATGGTGGTGSTGAKGQKGEASTVAGDKGQKGEIGATGSGGSTGSTGDKGQKGEEGPQGGGAPVGQIVAWSGSAGSLPSGYFLCDGSAISRSTYAALFTVVGTTHGAGNGSSTFNIPDLRDRFILGASNSTGDTSYPGVSPAATGGSADATLVSHSHTVNNHTHSFSGTTNNPGNHTHSYTFLEKNVAYGGGSSAYSRTTTSATTGGSGGHTHTVSGTTGGSSPGTNSQGSSATNANLPPYYALAYIIQYAQGGTTAKGQKGEVGAAGSGGSTGDKGQKGEAGDKGAASSVQGPAGDKGQKGEVGATGAGGSTGSAGAKGQKGEIGTTGDKGQKGEIGEKGQIGADGGSGADGTDGDKGQKGEVGSQGQAAIVKHVRQTSNFVRPTGNTSYGVAGNMQISVTAPSNNCLLFFNYQFNLRTLSSSAEGVTYRGRVFVNGTHSHNFIGQSETSSSTINNHKDFESEGYSGSTYYSANDTITIQLEIRNKDTGTGNRTQLDAGSYMTVFVFETS